MDSLKLTYLPISARGFPVRLCLRAAGIPFEDIRLPRDDLISNRGPTGSSASIPLGQLPTLEMTDGELFTQSIPISRWAAQQATSTSLYPKDSLNALRVEEMVAVLDELWSKVPLARHFGMSNVDHLTSARTEFVTNVAPKYWKKISSRLESSGGPFVLGSCVSFADLWISAFLIHLQTGMYSVPDGQINFQLIEPYPLIVKLFSAFKETELYKKFGEPN